MGRLEEIEGRLGIAAPEAPKAKRSRLDEIEARLGIAAPPEEPPPEKPGPAVNPAAIDKWTGQGVPTTAPGSFKLPKALPPEQTLGQKIKGVASWLGQAAVEAPGAIGGNPKEAADAAARGALSSMSMGLVDKPTTLEEARDIAYDHYGLEGPAAEAKAHEIVAREAGIGQERAALAGRQKAASLMGQIGGAAGGPGGVAARLLGRSLPVATSIAGRMLRRGAIGAGAAGTEGTGRALAQGEGLGAALGKGVEAAGTGFIVGAGAEGLASAAGGALNIIARAPARVQARQVKQLLEGVPAGKQTEALTKLGGREGLLGAVKKEGLTKEFMKGARDLDDAVDVKSAAVGEQIGNVFKGVDKASPGIPFPKISVALEKLKRKYKTGGDHQAVKAIDAELEGLRDSFAGENVIKQVAHVPAESLHQVAQRLGSRGYARFVHPTRGAELSRDMNDAVRGVLQKHVAEVTERNPSLGSLEKLKELNASYSRLRTLGQLADAKAERLERNAPTLGQRFREAGKKAAFWGGVGGAAATGNVLPLAIPAVTHGLPALGRGIDRTIAGAASLAKKLPGTSDAIAAVTRLSSAIAANKNVETAIASALSAGVPQIMIDRLRMQAAGAHP